MQPFQTESLDKQKTQVKDHNQNQSIHYEESSTNVNKERGQIENSPDASKNILFVGEDDVSPHFGDSVFIHYVIAVNSKNHIIENSRDRRKIPFSFVIGAGQVLESFDAMIRTFNRGERSCFTILPNEGYGNKGFPPLIPKDATLFCDVELISISTQPRLSKPWIQNV